MEVSPFSMLCEFAHPSSEFGPVPFWWWVGEPLDRERLIWQLDRLREKGVLNAIVSYNHHADGAPNCGDPAVFSPAWWSLFRDILEACRERGMQLSFQDYTLLNPILEELGEASVEMRGAGELREVHARVEAGMEVRLRVETSGVVVAAFAYPWRSGRASVSEAVDLTGQVKRGELDWRTPEDSGEWLVSLCWCQATPFDPLHPESGARVIERFYAMFEREVGEHLGKTLPISFQDELDFGAKMPRWSPVLSAEFFARKGYNIEPWLAALWHDLGPRSVKLRIDYADVVTRLLEERYFIPVFNWHEQHGLLYGNDNIGRGGIEAGRRAYGDAFRTMRWYSAPGTDDPTLGGPRAFKGLKVNSSIAHLYGRPRVWNEGFHSSGWGTAPAEVVAALNADFALGATVVNLHGLYYSTFGGWWEWAPPDFHFRQPYWDDTQALSGYAARLCQTLSRGVHVCDIAIVYPITALEGGLNPRVNSAGASKCQSRNYRRAKPRRRWTRRKRQPSGWGDICSRRGWILTSSTSNRWNGRSVPTANYGWQARRIECWCCRIFPRCGFRLWKRRGVSCGQAVWWCFTAANRSLATGRARRTNNSTPWLRKFCPHRQVGEGRRC